MSEIAPHAVSAGDPAVIAARTQEDVAVGNEIVRHRLSSRVMHWTVALAFMLTLITGMPIWTPIFSWMAFLVGGLHVCRWLHPWSGAAFFVGMLWMLIHWLASMKLAEVDKKWLSPTAIIKYLNYPETDQQTGKYNGGQKLFFYVVVIDAVLLFATGFVLWWPSFFPQAVREPSIPLHDIAFLLFVVSIIGHVYLGTAAFPGTFGSMMRGTVTRAWARLHHPKWYRDVTGDKRS